MQVSRLHSFPTFSFLLVFTSAVLGQDMHRHHETRDIVSQIGSLADSILGITTTQSTDLTAAATSTIVPTAATQSDGTTTATPQAVTVVPAAVATSSSSQISFSTTTSDTASSSTATSTAQPTASSVSTTTDQSSSQLPSPSSPQTSSTPATPANPIQGLSSSSATTSQVKQDSGNSVPTAGVVVAVVFGVLILAGIAYLLYRYFHNARPKPAHMTPPASNQLKRFSYSDDDAELGLVGNAGLGLGKVSRLKRTPDITAPSSGQSSRARSRAGSDDALFLDTAVPVSPLDRRGSPLRLLPNGAQEPWPIISPTDAPHPQSLVVKPPARTTPFGNPGMGYTPYRRNRESVIGLAVPLESNHTQLTQDLGPSRLILR